MTASPSAPAAESGADLGAGWYAATASAAPELRRLTTDLDVDVCILGGGIAGLTAALALARRGWSVAIVEEGRAGGAETGLSGLVSPGYAEPVERIVERVGMARAKALWDLSMEAVEQVRAALAGMTGVLAGEGNLRVGSRGSAAASRRHADLLSSAFSARAAFWPAERVRAVLRSTAFHEGVHLAEAFHIHPLNYALGLAAALRGAGGRLYEKTPVTGADLAPVRKRIVTPGGTVRARHVVLAAPGDLGRFHPPLTEMAMTLARPMGVTAPLGERLSEAVRFEGMATFGHHSHRLVGDGRLLWCGALTTRRAAPRRLARHIAREMGNLYPQLRGVPVEHAWYGHADYAVHRMPHVGELAPGLWLAAAFTHHGIAGAAMAGGLLAGAIDRSDERWQLFNSYGLVWTGGGLGRSALRTVFGARRMWETLCEGFTPIAREVRFDEQRPGAKIPPLPPTGSPSSSAP